MNRLLVVIIVVLIPVAIFTKSDSTEVMKGETLENIALEIPIKIEENDKEVEVKESNNAKTVLISNNKDKSNPYSILLEDYIVGVVAGEMPASFQMEALKAQAVASRTFAVNKMQERKNYVLSTTINDQVYLTEAEMKKKWGNDFSYYYNRVLEAVKATENQVVTFDDKPISAYYFAISNGTTEPAKVVFKEDKEYLVSVDSKWDKNYSSVSSSRTIDRNVFCSKLGISCNGINITNIKRSENNYVREITINNVKFSGLDVFNKLGLKSTDFTITVNDNTVIIKTLGFGHSVGMSQYGAQGMAKEGYTYEEILTHYYKNTKVEMI